MERRIWDKFMADLKIRFEQIRAGTPEMDLDLGPVISAGQKSRIGAMLQRAERDGARILAQGQIASNTPADGFYVQPTIYHEVNPASELAQLEVFGPVLAAMPLTPRKTPCASRTARITASLRACGQAMATAPSAWRARCARASSS